ncbi:MAG: hypothetical protein KDE47_14320, partial [Caldilineaceae bacterium]|nr:hypothetical protein [Caldilineaceae bacterium]
MGILDLDMKLSYIAIVAALVLFAQGISGCLVPRKPWGLRDADATGAVDVGSDSEVTTDSANAIDQKLADVDVFTAIDSAGDTPAGGDITDGADGGVDLGNDAVDVEELDGVAPPRSTITAAPVNTTSRGASFGFTCDQAPCTYQCQLDEGIWVPCTSPHEYFDVGVGEHTFKVQAEKNGVFENSPQKHTWTILAISSIECGVWNTCALLNDNSLWCWGDNTYGQLGIGSNDEKDQLVPIKIGTSSWDQLSYGQIHACAISAGKLYCWGNNYSFQLGYGGSSLFSPKQVGSDDVWVHVSSGGGHTCGIKDVSAFTGQFSNVLYCWGSVFSGQVGNNVVSDLEGDNVNAPLKIGNDTDWAIVTVGYESSCAIKTDKSLYCWGANASVSAPAKVGSDANWDHVSLGSGHTCAIKTDKSLYCWGGNTYGQLGHSTPGNTPQPVGQLKVWERVSVGSQHSCAIRSDGSLWCWGDNADGQLGVDSISGSTETPTRVGLAKWKVISAGNSHSCGIKDDDSLWC